MWSSDEEDEAPRRSATTPRRFCPPGFQNLDSEGDSSEDPPEAPRPRGAGERAAAGRREALGPPGCLHCGRQFGGEVPNFCPACGVRHAQDEPEDDAEDDARNDDDAAPRRTPATARPPPGQPRRQVVYGRFECVDPDALTPAESDAFIQLVLHARGFEFLLKWYQPRAVRFVASVEANWPRAFLDSSVEATLRSARRHGVAERHGILADEMGCGKTVQCVGGVELRRAIATARGLLQLPALVVAPSDAVLDQWVAHLPTGATRFVYKGSDRDARLSAAMVLAAAAGDDSLYVLATRYTLLNSMRAACASPFQVPALFPRAPPFLLRKLHLVYLSKTKPVDFLNLLKAVGREDLKTWGELMVKGKADEATIVRELIQSSGLASRLKTFDIAILDEAHLLKNPVSLWGMFVALVGTASRFLVNVTGTPFVNGASDVAALVSYGDAGHFAAAAAFWKAATETKGGQVRTDAEIAAKVGRYLKTCDLSRKKADVLRGMLPPKSVSTISIEIVRAVVAGDDDVERNDYAQSGELKVYLVFDRQAQAALGEYVQSVMHLERNPTPLNKARVQQKFVVFMAYLQLSRAALLHPILPRGGRAYTRRLLGKKHKHGVCVDCEEDAAKAAAGVIGAIAGGVAVDKEASARRAGLAARTEDDDDDGAPADDDDDEERPARAMIRDESEELVDLTAPFGCVGHCMHRMCSLQKQGALAVGSAARCPRCVDQKLRLKMGAHGGGEAPRLVCRDVEFGGFALSSKLSEALRLILDAWRRGEKMIVYSGFKGALDLLEAVLTHEPEYEKVGCARYDGDVAAAARAKALERFKTEAGCCALLATVHCAGVGLNVVEANHVVFLDRWFNPTVHDQAMDRCHRIGQTKPVMVTFLDAKDTVDDIMKVINDIKQQNATVLLADGTAMGAAAQGIGWKKLAGVLVAAFKRMEDARKLKMGLKLAFHATFDAAGATLGGGVHAPAAGAPAAPATPGTPRARGVDQPPRVTATKRAREDDEIRRNCFGAAGATVAKRPAVEPAVGPTAVPKSGASKMTKSGASKSTAFVIDDDDVPPVAARDPSTVVVVIDDDDEDDVQPVARSRPAAAPHGSAATSSAAPRGSSAAPSSSAPRGSSAATPSAADWSCTECMFVHKDARRGFLVCEMCAAPRPPLDGRLHGGAVYDDEFD